MVLGLVELINAKGFGVAQLIWLYIGDRQQQQQIVSVEAAPENDAVKKFRLHYVHCVRQQQMRLKATKNRTVPLPANTVINRPNN